MPKYVNPDDLEAVSDALLKLHGAGSGEYPAYIERHLLKRERRRGECSLEEAFESSPAEIRQCADVVLEIAWCEIRSGAVKVGLSARQIQFLELRRTMSQADIAKTTGWSVGTVSQDMNDSVWKLQSIKAFGLWTVLAEVFRLPCGRIKDLLINK